MTSIHSLYFCNAYPLTEEDFIAGSRKDFMQLYAEHKKRLNEQFTWEEYKKDVVTPYILLKNNFRKYGFNFLDNVTFKDIASLINNDKQEVIILFTHCRNGGLQSEQIEFYDDLHDWESILDVIPINYDKILDLGVCNPSFLAEKIRVLRPGCVTRYAQTGISIILWIVFYAELLKNMVHMKNYFRSYEEAVYKFWRE